MTLSASKLTLGSCDPSIDVSIILVNWNAVDLLRACLASLQQVGHVAYEAIVVDNASHDGSVHMAQREFPAVRLLVNTHNKGFAAANNQGLSQARGRYFLLLNTDTVILPGAVEAMVRYLDAHPQVGALGPRLLYEDRTFQVSAYPFPRVTQDALVMLQVNRWPLVRILARRYGRRRDARMSTQTGEVDWVSGACLLLRREAIEQVGVLDEGYFFGAEEMDLCFRLPRHGWSIIYLTSADVIHLGGRSRERINATHLIWYYTAKMRFYRLYFSRPDYLLIRAALALSAIGHLIGLLARAQPSKDHLLLRTAYTRILIRAVEG